jgi:hypothetical protein
MTKHSPHRGDLIPIDFSLLTSEDWFFTKFKPINLISIDLLNRSTKNEYSLLDLAFTGSLLF